MSNHTDLQALGEATIGANKGLYLGSSLLGQLVDAVLLGVEVLMFIHWVTWGSKERLTTRILVPLAVLFSFGVSAFNLACMLKLFGYGFGDYSLFLQPKWKVWNYVLNALVVATVQIYFLEKAFRLYKRSIVIAIPLLVLILVALAAGAAKTAYLLIKGYVVQDSSLYKTFYYLWIGAIIPVELALAALISYGLWKFKTAWDSTDSLRYKISKVVWEAQLPATLITLVFALIQVATMGYGIRDFFEKCYTKAFSIGLLVVLNSQFSLAKTRDTSENTWTRRNTTNHQATVMVNTETYVERSQIAPPKVGVNRQAGSHLSLDDISEDDKSPIDDLAFIHNDSSMGLTTPQEEDVKVVLR